MDTILGQFAQYGFGGLCCALMLYWLMKDNSRLKDDADKDNQWKMDIIQQQTVANVNLTTTLAALQNTMTAAVDKLNTIDGKVSK